MLNILKPFKHNDVANSVLRQFLDLLRNSRPPESRVNGEQMLRRSAAACRHFLLMSRAIMKLVLELRICPWHNQNCDPHPIPHVLRSDDCPRKAGRYFRSDIAAVLVVLRAVPKVIRHDWLHPTLSATEAQEILVQNSTSPYPVSATQPPTLSRGLYKSPVGALLVFIPGLVSCAQLGYERGSIWTVTSR